MDTCMKQDFDPQGEPGGMGGAQLSGSGYHTEIRPDGEQESGYFSTDIIEETNNSSSTILQSDIQISSDTLTGNSDSKLNTHSVEELNAALSMMLLGDKQCEVQTEGGQDMCDYEKEERIFISMNKQLYQQDLATKDNQFMLMIMKAKSDQDLQMIDTALDYVLDPVELDVQNDYGQTALILAVLCHIPNLVAKIMCGGASVKLLDKYGNSAFHYACESGDINCLRALTESVSGPLHVHNVLQVLPWQNKDGFNCVDLAINKNRIDVFDYLMEKFNVSINYQDRRDGSTALHKAVITRDYQTLAVLLQYKEIDVNARNFCGFTPLRLLYITEGKAESDQTIEKLLLQKGAVP